MSRNAARFRTQVAASLVECTRCGNEYHPDSLIVSPAGDDACWGCLRSNEQALVMEEALAC